MITAGHTRRLVALIGAAGMLLTACGDGDEPTSEASETVTETVTESATPSDEPSETATADDGNGAAAGLPPEPRRDECVEIDAPRDGRYTVYDAGTAVVRRDGDRLRIGKVSAAGGWQSRVTDRGGDDDVEIEFRPRQGGPELELEVEIDDGRVESKICADDPDGRDGRDDRDDDNRDDDNRDD